MIFNQCLFLDLLLLLFTSTGDIKEKDKSKIELSQPNIKSDSLFKTQLFYHSKYIYFFLNFLQIA